MRVLEPEIFATFLDRFSRFGDGKVHHFTLDWCSDGSRAEIGIVAMDRDSEWKWTEVLLQLKGLQRAFWASDWRGSIECGELILRQFDSQVVVAVGGSDDGSYCSLAGFNEQTTSMILVGTKLEYNVGSRA